MALFTVLEQEKSNDYISVSSYMTPLVFKTTPQKGYFVSSKLKHYKLSNINYYRSHDVYHEVTWENSVPGIYTHFISNI